VKISSGHLRTVAALLALALSAGCGKSPEKVRLRIRLEPGKSYVLRFVTDQDISQTMMNRQQNMKQTMDMTMTYDVRGVDDAGVADVKVAYSAIRFKQSGPMGTVEYDSAKPPKTLPPQARAFSALVGQSITMKLSPRGRISDIQGAGALIDKIFKSMNPPKGRMSTMVRKGLKEQFGEESMKDMMQQMMALYPEKPVGVGDSWSSTMTVSKGFPMVMEHTWTLTGVEDGSALVAVSSQIKPNLDAVPIRVGPINMTHRFTGEQKGTLKIDLNTGWITSGDMTQSFSGAIKMEGGPGKKQNMSMPMSIKGKIRIESK